MRAQGISENESGAGGSAVAVEEHVGHLSLEGLHSSVLVPDSEVGFWRQWRAFAGPAILVSVGYMDPGNWGTDLAGGSQYKYGLLWVVGVASLMAIFLQVVAARLGVATGKDLAQCCRDWYPRWTRWPNWVCMEIAIGMTDLAEALGSAVALNLLFHIPMSWAIIITAFDVLLLLALQGFGMRLIEAVVAIFVLTIGVCYGIEIFGLAQTRPDFLEMGQAMVRPNFGHAGMLVVAIGIIGATVMPHNLYLHTALVQSRRLRADEPFIRRAIRFNTIDTTVALTIAFFVNAAILVLAATVFYGKTSITVAGGQVVTFSADSDWIRVAHLTLAPLLGTTLASTLFAVALLASGQSSTITGTLAGQVVMEGFMHWRIRPWIRRLDYTNSGRYTGDPDYQRSREWQRDRSGQPEPSRPLSCVAVCDVPAATFRQLAQAPGAMAERMVLVDCRLGKRHSHHGHGHLQPAGCVAAGMGGHRRSLKHSGILVGAGMKHELVARTTRTNISYNDLCG